MGVAAAGNAALGEGHFGRGAREGCKRGVQEGGARGVGVRECSELGADSSVRECSELGADSSVRECSELGAVSWVSE